MEKPLIVSEKELNEEIAMLVNKYLMELPASVIRNSFKDVIPTLDHIANEQLDQAVKEYNNFLAKEQEVVEDGGQTNN